MTEYKEKFTVSRHKTGETLETADNLAWLFEKPRKGDFYMIHENIVHDRNLDLTDMRVYFTLCKLMDPGGWILQTQGKISMECGIAQSNICASMKKLLSAQYLTKERQGKTGRELYRVNPAYSSKGPISMRKSRP